MIVDNNSPVTGAVQAMKQAFFACRNGVVADALRAAGDPHRYIMGCQLTDVASIVSQFSHFSQHSQFSHFSHFSQHSQDSRISQDSQDSQDSQLSQLSRDSQQSQPSQDSFFAHLSRALWTDRDHRECRMAATMLYPPNEFSQETALEWARGVETSEIADVLCHRLLRKLPFALELADQLLADETPLVRYTAFRLLLNLLLMGKATPTVALRQRVEKELARGEALLRPLLASLQEELADAAREMA